MANPINITPGHGKGGRHATAETLAAGAKAVALVLLPALVLMLAFAFSYVGAFHEPTPHDG